MNLMHILSTVLTVPRKQENHFSSDFSEEMWSRVPNATSEFIRSYSSFAS